MSAASYVLMEFPRSINEMEGTLVHGLYEADPWTVIRNRPVIRWLDEQLLRVDP